MKTKKVILLSLMLTFLVIGCRKVKKEETLSNQKLEEIEEVEKALDSTVNEVHKKAQVVEKLIKDLDSI